MNIKKFDLLVSLYITCIALSELMGGKTFTLFSIGLFQLSSSVAIFVIPILFTINDVITEVYGRERTQSVVRSGLLMIVLILLFSVLSTSLPPSVRFAGSEKAYDQVFGTSIRIALASLTAFALAEFFDVLVFVKLRENMGKRALWFRNNVSNFIAQFFDTAVFMTLAFYALHKSFENNLLFLLGLILPYWLLKCFMSIIETPLVYLGVSWLKGEKKHG